MVEKRYKELKPGEEIKVFGEIFIIKKIELSEKGIKQGRRKCRIEVKNKETKEGKTIIRLADELVKTI